MKGRSRDKTLQQIKVTAPSQLLEYLIANNVRKSRNAIKSLLAHKQITVNGKIVTQYNHELLAGDVVEIMKFDQTRKEKRLKGAKIVFEDEHLIIIDKESGMLSVSTDKEKSRTIYSVLNEYVKGQNKLSRVFVLHRLDREVSGLMIFAKSAEVQSFFQRAWDNIVRVYTYAAVTEGVVKPKEGTITSWLTENKNFQVFSSPSDNGGQKAVSHYKVVKSNKNYSLVDLTLETKRKNQLRVQMQSIQHPIVGDKKYGASENPIKRIALHGYNIVMKHPITGEVMEFKSDIPKTMMQLVNQ